MQERNELPPTELIRAAGSGHSTSDVARPSKDAILLSLEHLALDDADWKTWIKGDLSMVEPRVRPGEQLVRVSAGQTIRALNLDLAKRRLAMPNLGSYDGQSIYGAIATGTHGTGLGFGPLADLVASIEMIGVEDAGRPVQLLSGGVVGFDVEHVLVQGLVGWSWPRGPIASGPAALGAVAFAF